MLQFTTGINKRNHLNKVAQRLNNKRSFSTE